MEKSSRLQKLNWRIVVGVLVAFVLGGAVGGLVERQRINSSNAKGSASATTEDWFGSQKTAACPTLLRWTRDGAVSYAAVLSAKTNWEASRATLLRTNADVTASYQALIPFADANGKAQLESLVTYSNQLSAAIQTAPSADALLASSQALNTQAVKNDGIVLGAAAGTCPKA